MKNTYDIDVSFSTCPKMPYEWENTTTILHVKLYRVTTSLLKSVLLYEGALNTKEKIILLSDGIETVALKLNDKGLILKRSFLKFADSLDISEFAHSLKCTKFDFISSQKKVMYEKSRGLEKEVEDYILKTIKENSNEDLSKYLYYLYFNEVEGYSKDKLIKSVKSSCIDKNMKLYKFLTKC